MKSLSIGLALIGALALTGCNDYGNEDAQTKKVLNVVDESDLNDVMLEAADPNEAVNYFANTLQQDPERDDLRRGLAQSLLKARRATEAVVIYKQLDDRGAMDTQDRLNYSDALIRAGEWDQAKAQMNQIPPSVETYQRYLLEALIADSEKDWKKADSFYNTAAGLTTQPASVLNNWGYSKLTRRDFKGAAVLFSEAITHDKKMFTAKNNLVLARGAMELYDLPIIPMNTEEKAVLTYTAGLAAVKNGDKSTGRSLFQKAIDLHPRHFEEAANSLKALG